MRIGEVAGLQWRDLDLDARVARVRRTCRGEATSEPKSGKARTVDLSAQLVDALRELHRQRPVVALDHAARERASVFPDKRTGTRPMQYRRFYELFVPTARQLGLGGVTPHVLDTYASLLLANGESPLYVQEQLGHHDPKFTLSVYGHLIPRRDRRGRVDFLDGLASSTQPPSRSQI